MNVEIIEEVTEQTANYIPKNTMLIGIGVFLLINIIAFLLMWIDKKRSMRRPAHRSGKNTDKKKRKHHRRIPEAVLLGFAVCGGGFGILFGMIAFRHKINASRHQAFVTGVPIILLIELIAALFLFASRI